MNIQKSNNQSAFTVIELLIVIVVVAILAAITIVGYNAFQDRSVNTAVEADLSTMSKKLEVAKADLSHYPQTISEFPDFKLNKSVYTPSRNNVYYCYDRTNDVYALGVVSKPGRGYILNSGNLSSGVSVSGAATCSAIGKTWVNDATTYVVQGYAGPPTSAWSGSWGWTQ